MPQIFSPSKQNLHYCQEKYMLRYNKKQKARYFNYDQIYRVVIDRIL